MADRLDHPVLRAVVDGFVQAALPQEGVLAAACRSVDRGADVARDVDRGKSDTAAGDREPAGIEAGGIDAADGAGEREDNRRRAAIASARFQTIIDLRLRFRLCRVVEHRPVDTFAVRMR